MQHKSIAILTEQFPETNQELFLDRDIVFLKKKFHTIYLLPVHKFSDNRRDIPENCQLIYEICNINKVNKKAVFKNILLIIKILVGEWFYRKNFFSYFKDFKTHFEQLIHVITLSYILEKGFLKKNTEPLTWYSVWNNKSALLLSILKKKKLIKSFSIRLQGYDLFEERSKHAYLPYQHFKFRHADFLFPLSTYGKNYLENKYPQYKHKYHVLHFGINDYGINKLKENSVFTVVSCSNVIPIKRVDLILKAIKLITDFKIKWIHFGSGSDFEALKLQSINLPENVEVEYRGHVDNKIILDYYLNNSINLFLHVSITEGLGFALIEAGSFGIPIMACNSGGVLDIVNEETGVLLPVDITPNELKEQIILFKNSYKNTTEFRKNVRRYILNKFSVENSCMNLAVKLSESPI